MIDEAVRARGLRKERNQASARFRDGHFFNTRPTMLGPKPGMRLEVGKELLFGGQERRPPRALPIQRPLAQWARPVESGSRVTWLGHSTVLLELDGMRVLTDPVWSDRISPFGIAAPKRFQGVPATIAELPKLDAIVISHDHFDHLDHGTVRALTPLGVPFVTALGVGHYLQAWGVPPAQIIELDWWETATLRGGDLALTATPSQHFSGRVGGRNRTLWASFVIATAKRRIFFSGDTALTPEFVDVAAKYGPFELTMLEIGGFHPSWDHIHLGPANALEAFRMLGGGRLMPVHWATFNLALHAWDWPGETITQLAAEQRVDLYLPPIGAAFEPTREPLRASRWWREDDQPLTMRHSPPMASGL